jgi:hypothetical protein
VAQELRREAAAFSLPDARAHQSIATSCAQLLRVRCLRYCALDRTACAAPAAGNCWLLLLWVLCICAAPREQQLAQPD